MIVNSFSFVYSSKIEILTIWKYNISMQQIINDLQKVENYKKQLRETCKRNKINIKTILGLTTKKMVQYYDRTLKHYSLNPEKAKSRWYQNELRLFHWLAIIKSLLFYKPIKQFEIHHWQQIKVFFPQKPISMFEFQVTKLITFNTSQSYRSWTQEECDLLTQIMKQGNMGNRWKDVSRMFYEKSDRRLYRCSKQCRQQWLNHLDSSKIQGQWTSDEDLKILQSVIQYGHRWAKICRYFLPKRTEHMVKNRFNSMIAKNFSQKQLRIYNERKIIGKLISRIQNIKNSVNSQSKIEYQAIREASSELFEQKLIEVFLNQNGAEASNQQKQSIEKEQKQDLFVSPKEQLSDKSPLVDYSNTFSYMNPHMFAVPQPITAQMPLFAPNFFLVGNAYCGFPPSFFMGGF